MLLSNIYIENSIPKEWKPINNRLVTPNYCTVFEDAKGGLIVTNLPKDTLIANLFFRIIKKAESNKKNCKYVRMKDIANIINSIHYPPLKISLYGLSINDIPKGDIECCYRFPMDRSFLVKLYDGSIMLTFEKK
jgi:hypothetical protein